MALRVSVKNSLDREHIHENRPHTIGTKNVLHQHNFYKHNVPVSGLNSELKLDMMSF